MFPLTDETKIIGCTFEYAFGYAFGYAFTTLLTDKI
jgi:hypothetical protein